MIVKFYNNEHFNGNIHWNFVERKFFIEEKELSEIEIKEIIKDYNNKEYNVRINEHISLFNIGNDKFIMVL